jgi:hemoglobin
MTKAVRMFQFNSGFNAMNINKLLAAATLGAFLAFATTARAEETLFAQIGGEATLKATVDTMTDIMLDDDRINFTFANTDLAKFKKLLYEQLCELAGGPCKYTGRTMFEAHKKLNTNNAQFNALAEDLYIAFEKHGVPYHVQNKMMALLAPLQPDVVKKNGTGVPDPDAVPKPVPAPASK